MGIERELSVLLSTPPSLYSALLVVLSQAPPDYYTCHSESIKNVFQCKKFTGGIGGSGGGGDDCFIGKDGDDCRKHKQHIYRTVQDKFSFLRQCKLVLKRRMVRRIYKHPFRNTTLFLSVRDSVASESLVDEFEYTDYVQTVRDYIYCRITGMRIAIERRFCEFNDGNIRQLAYDCFNRYNYTCYVHIEWEIDPEMDNKEAMDQFMEHLVNDNKVVYKLLTLVCNKNLTNVSDELINIRNLPLTHNYGYQSDGKLHENKYYAVKYDGTRFNFCIYGKYIQLENVCLEFKNHWFGQVVIGHYEQLCGGEVILIDVYLVTENYHRISKKLNISYVGALQSYHEFYNTLDSEELKGTTATTTAVGVSGAVVTGEGGGGGLGSIGSNNSSYGSAKLQDMYFHRKRLKKNATFINHMEAINVIELLDKIWSNEPEISARIQLQKFYRSLGSVKRKAIDSHLDIDGLLAFSNKKILKMKAEITIDLLWKSDGMYRYLKKTGGTDIAKLSRLVNIQKTINWSVFDAKYPGRLDSVVVDFLFFSGCVRFSDKFPDWSVYLNVAVLEEQIAKVNFTLFNILLEFVLDINTKTISFTRIRSDKCSPNSEHVFRQMQNKNQQLL
jgi:hypothetical protein